MPPVDYDPGATSVVAVGRLADRLLGGLPR
jgi:hypothetical protein